MPHFKFQSYSWSFGTTSFRMADFHRKVEEQLGLLNDFWNISENSEMEWTRENEIQKRYYEYLLDKGFIYGKIDSDENKEKTAREKTSGLTDIGLIGDNHRLTEVGEKLLAISKSGDFSSDNEFHVPKDSFIYLKQLIKTANKVQENYVRPYLVTGLVFNSCDDYLTDEEFTYLLPLCVDAETTNTVIRHILSYRKGKITIDDIILDIVLTRYSYPAAKRYFISSNQTDEDIMDIGMNRKSPTYDRSYVELYKQLKNVYICKDEAAIPSLYQATGGIKGGKVLWRKLLFSVKRPKKYSDLSATPFDKVNDEKQFNSLFFDYLHLFKIKTNLYDYKDLNRRYLNITDSILFSDGKVCFTPIFQSFFKTSAKALFDDAYKKCSFLQSNCALSDINSCLVFDDSSIVAAFNKKNGTTLKSIDEFYDHLENDRYSRFRELVDSKFPNDVILDMLNKFETRVSDGEIIAQVGSEADGGMSDIVYKYDKSDSYPQHDLLIECTLMEGMTQRHGEMEPVSRHLANYMIDENPNAYCTFVSNNLHASVISDFRGRKNSPYYRSDTEHVDSMKIIPLHTQELRTILEKGITYDRLYGLFEAAYASEDVKAPPEWYRQKIRNEIEKE